ncbi:zinc-ribbon domain-containing protein [Halomicrobium urmianum]|uniref:zinc-ribbon domain-containing protein n=1 Tax=Halomicrobium urmianum TaxID=1586233 RepID=UPI001CDA00B5|nr:zinc-ribbon domain-containing protein [Halomicrobium urmianum]
MQALVRLLLGTRRRDDTVVECRRCGKTLEDSAVECHHCGEPHSSHFTYCPACGSDAIAVYRIQ